MIHEIAKAFAEEIQLAKAGQKNSLKYLDSYFTKPSGQEQGEYLALDFGGTKVTLILFRLLGQGRWQKVQETSFLLTNPQGQYDYTKGTSEELFTFLAKAIKAFLSEKKVYRLGHTFSFPFLASSKGDGTFLQWTKEFQVTKMTERPINAMLQQALWREGMQNVQVTALLNDTTAVLLAGCYVFADCLIGSVIGTGFNCCYLAEGKMINLECGNFDRLPFTDYDDRLDQESENPGEQRLEKMVSGRYLGEVARLMLAEEGLGTEYADRHSFSTWQLAQVLQKKEESREKDICAHVLQRSAMLAASCYRGICTSETEPNRVLVDGSVFSKAPGYQDLLQRYLPVTIQLAALPDSSALGAAVAAALID